MRRNMTVDWDAQGKYSTTLFTEEAVKLIKEHNTDDPMFMYLAHLAPHSGNDDDPLQAPDEEIAKFSYIQDPERRIYAAMVSMLDKSVGSVVAALREKHMLENSIIVFMSDNGAQPEGIHANHGSNYPLRGVKDSGWDGSLRNVAAIWSPLIKKSQRVSNHLMHVSDWLPTFYSAAGLNKSELPAMDGVDMWKTISEGAKNPRTELLHNIDDLYPYGALRQGDWKYLYGSTSKGKADGWYGTSGKQESYHYDEDLILSSSAANAFAGIITYQQIKEKNDNQHHHDFNFTINILDKEKIQSIRESAVVKCKKVNLEEQDPTTVCKPMESPCLFNIIEDPCEMINLAISRPMVVANMEQTMMKYRKSAKPIINVPRDPNADPIKWNNTWTNWQDCDVIIKHKLYNTLSPLTIGLISAACFAFFIIVVVLTCVNRLRKPKRSRPNSYFEERDETTIQITPKDNMFEDRELKLMDNIRRDSRTVE